MFGANNLWIYVPLIVLPIGVYLYSLYINSYWKRNKIPFVPAKPIVGNLFDLFRFRKCAAEVFEDLYNHPNAIGKPFVGIHFFHKPILLIRDPKLIKQILVKDFASFNDRNMKANIHSDVIGSTNLFMIPNPMWKVLRSRMTPFFTGGKLKQMFHLMQNIGNQMNDKLFSNVKEKTNSFDVDLKDVFTRYTTGVIGSCAFGIEANSFADTESEFMKYGKRIFDGNWHRALELAIVLFMPKIVPLFKFKVKTSLLNKPYFSMLLSLILFTKESNDFFRKAINEIIAERESSGLVRHDLIETLINLRDEDKSKNFSPTNIVFQGDVIVAQAALFFIAGYETSSTTLTFAMFELAHQPHLQTKVREEIKKVLLASNGELTYDNLNEMVYLNMVVQETLRMYPPAPFIDRKCTKRDGYSLEPYDNFVIRYNMPIFISIYAIHRDAEYWPNPTIFDPERFSAENLAKIVPDSNLAMGAGPRMCIGDRFALLQTKVGLVNFLKNHKVSPTENTPRVLQFETKSVPIQPKDGIVLNVVRDCLL